MRRKIVRRELGEGEIADFLRGLWVFQEAQHFAVIELREKCFGFIGTI